MKHFVVLAATLLLTISTGLPAHAGLGESSTPQRHRCETQASAKFSMWHWFSRRDFVQRCLNSTGGTKSKGKKRTGAR